MTSTNDGSDVADAGRRWTYWCASAGLLGFCLTVTVPFMVPFHYFPINLFYAEWSAFALGLAAMSLVFVGSFKVALKIPPVAAGLLALVLVIAIQVALSYVAYVETALLVSFYVLWAALLVIAAANIGEIVGVNRVYSQLQSALVFGGVVTAAIGFIQYYQIETPWGHFVDVQNLQIGYMFGLVGQRNNFSDYVACGLISTLFAYSRGAVRAPFAILAVAMMSVALMLAASRTTMVYFVVAVLAVVAARRISPSQFKSLFTLLLFSILVCVLTQVLAATTDLLARPGIETNTVLGRVAKDIGGSDGANIRGPLLIKSWNAFRSSPWIGVGAGELTLNMFWQTADQTPPVTPGIIDRHAHNLFMQLLAEFGLAGLIAVGGTLLYWARAQVEGRSSYHHLWAIAVIAVIGAHSMVEFPLWIAHFLGIFALLVGLTSRRLTVVKHQRIVNAGLLLICLSSLVIAFGNLVDYRNIERWYLRAESKQKAGGVVDGRDLQMLMAYHDGTWLAPFIESVASSAIILDEEHIADKLALNTQVMHAFPTPTVVERQIVLLQLGGREVEARRAMLAMVRLWPDEAKVRAVNFDLLAQRNPRRFLDLARYLREILSSKSN